MSFSNVIPAKAGTHHPAVVPGGTDWSWVPAFGVPTKYYFVGRPFAGMTGVVCG